MAENKNLSEVKSQLKSKVYNSLSNIAYELFDQKFTDIPVDQQEKLMEESIEWFMIHFFEK